MFRRNGRPTYAAFQGQELICKKRSFAASQLSHFRIVSFATRLFWVAKFGSLSRFCRWIIRRIALKTHGQKRSWNSLCEAFRVSFASHLGENHGLAVLCGHMSLSDMHVCSLPASVFACVLVTLFCACLRSRCRSGHLLSRSDERFHSMVDSSPQISFGLHPTPKIPIFQFNPTLQTMSCEGETSHPFFTPLSPKQAHVPI